MESAKIDVTYQTSEGAPQKRLSVVHSERKIDEPLPDFNFLRTFYETSHGLKAWVSLKSREYIS